MFAVGFGVVLIDIAGSSGGSGAGGTMGNGGNSTNSWGSVGGGVEKRNIDGSSHGRTSGGEGQSLTSQTQDLTVDGGTGSVDQTGNGAITGIVVSITTVAAVVLAIADGGSGLNLGGITGIFKTVSSTIRSLGGNEESTGEL